MCKQPPTPIFIPRFCDLGLKPFPACVRDTVNASASFQIENDDWFVFSQEVDDLFPVIFLTFIDIEPHFNLSEFAFAFEVFFDLNLCCLTFRVNLNDGSKYNVGTFPNDLPNGISFRNVSFYRCLSQYEDARNK